MGALAVKCPACGSAPLQRCYGNGPMSSPHNARVVEASRMEVRDLQSRAEKAEAALAAMRAEADKWAAIGWRDLAEQDAALAAGCNRAAEAILSAGR